ncbi:hypothetical protein GALMADRAFT_81807, partial [Galerina marginata CBS 339.88]
MPRTPDEIRVLTYNVAKNSLALDVCLSTLVEIYDVIFVQEPPWRIVRQAPSTSSRRGDDVIGTANHPDWIPMFCPQPVGVAPRCIAFVNKGLGLLRPSLRRDLIDSRDIVLLSLYSGKQIFNIMGVYSDADHTAIKLLAEKANSLPPLIYMGGDFNCHSSEWDPDCRSHGTTAISLLDTAATLGLELAIAQNSGPTFISHNPDLRPSVIDLVFVPPAQAVSLTTCLEPELKMQSDHVPISAFVPIRSSRLDAGKRSVPLVDQTEYLDGIIAQIWGLPITDLTSPELVEAAANTVAEIFADAFTRFSKPKSITSRSSPWWTPECATSLATYRASLSKHDWKSFRKLCKEVKRKFFEERIVDIAYSNKRPWDLMNWVQKRTLPACEALSYQGAPCISLNSLWDALHGTYNSASGR